MADSVENVYGTALFQLCEEEGVMDTVFSELTEINDILFSEDQKEFVELLASPLVSAEDKAKALDGVFADKISALTLDFLCLVSEKGRIRFLPRIYGRFKEMYNERNNILEVTAITAKPLSDRLRIKLAEKLERVSGNKIVLIEKLDESLLGGIVLRYSNTEIDSSVRTKLDQIRSQIDSVIA